MREKLILHPLLFAVYPIIALMASNIEEFPIYESFRFITISIIVAFFLVEVINLFTKSKERAALIASASIILFFTYSHFRTISQPWIILGYSFGRHRFLIPIWGLLLVLSIWVVTKTRMNLSEGTKITNLISLTSLLITLYTILNYQIQQFMAEDIQQISINTEIVRESQFSRENRPDIYYIILDGYGRADVLNELYSFDNNDLISYLETRGFYVAEESYTNYSRTIHSMASSLNLSFVEALAENNGVELSNKFLGVAIKHSTVRQLIEQNGYQFVTFDSGFEPSQITDSDSYLKPSSLEKPSTNFTLMGFKIRLNSFESFLFYTSTLGLFKDSFLLPPFEASEFEEHRERIVFTFEHLADFTQNEGSHFIFAHIVSPHPPFVFDEDGQHLIKMRVFTLSDSSGWVNNYGSREEYISGYRSQLIYINTLLKSAIEKILASSTTQPIIIIQGDHGPGAYHDWASPETTNMKERMSILNAYYFPDGDDGWLYPTITPINSFRVLFNLEFGANFELLEDRSYFLGYAKKHFILEVTNRLD
ncbi:MAG: hypothetical protein FVQ83_03575 [Chloroflexi bacterium]|nr:hypothetical protein [Chloroflexota bacterium]